MNKSLAVFLLASLCGTGSAFAHFYPVPLPGQHWDYTAQGKPYLSGTTPPASKTAASKTPGALSVKDAALLHKIHGFMWGKPSAPAKAIVFIDPNCIWCHRFFEQVKSGVKAGKARYLVIPVAILKKSSGPKAERIMQAKNPQNLFLQDETHFNVTDEEGGLPSTFPHPDKVIKDMVAINTAVLSDLENGHPATPSFVVRSPKGPVLHEGFPLNHG